METAAIVTGVVVDEVTGMPAGRARVQTQGVARSGWSETRADENGRFQLNLKRDHYNIWAVVDDRMPIAVKALLVEPGRDTPDVKIRLVRGGFVTGRVLEASGKPITVSPKDRLSVAHYGPARPRTGAAVTSVPVQPDGSYRLRVAPGLNYVYVMNGSASARIDVEDGKEIRLDLVVGTHAADEGDLDIELASRLRRDVETERQEKERIARPGARLDFPPRPAAPPNRQRADTPVGRLLNRLETQNSGRSQFSEKWLRTLKEIVDLGPDAVPELIAELDATSNDMMLRCLGFALRAIGDNGPFPP